MDLSHWDAVSHFSRTEIALLLAGADPNASTYPPTVEVKAQLFLRLIDEAASRAYDRAVLCVGSITQQPEVIAPDVFLQGELPSYELRCIVGDIMWAPERHRLPTLSELRLNEKFAAEDVHDWATWAQINEGYRFDGIANDRLPDSSPAPVNNAVISDGQRGPTRDRDLQLAAEALVAKLREDKRRDISKREIARLLAKTDEWKDLTSSRIERILRVTW